MQSKGVKVKRERFQMLNNNSCKYCKLNNKIH